jgi:hypothetical protein
VAIVKGFQLEVQKVELAAHGSAAIEAAEAVEAALGDADC